jgi:hypothetical protein
VSSASTTVTSRPERPGAGGDLGADEATADDDERPAGRELGPEGSCVVEGAQDVDAGEVVGAGQPARAGAGGEHDRVGGEPCALVERHGAGRRVELDGPHPQPPRDVEVLVVLQQRLRGRLVRRGEEGLRQRRPVVRQVRLVADDGDVTRETLRPQRPRRRDTGERGADDQDGAHHRATARSVWFGIARPA